MHGAGEVLPVRDGAVEADGGGYLLHRPVGRLQQCEAGAHLGYPVKEMIGGYQYWVEEGLPVRTPVGLTTER